MSLIEFIHNSVHFCVGHAASLQCAAVVDGLQNNSPQVATVDRRLYFFFKEVNTTEKQPAVTTE